MERSIKGDYIGFTFGDVHSSELGLVRVSDGSRYNTDLLPPLEDKVAQVAGRDGEVLFGTTYKAKEIKVPVAFDNMTEESFRRLTQLLADKKPKSLWFDESPYKEWIVKSANVQDFKWVCFDESRGDDNAHEKKRIYKGEGTLIFKCRSPYAQSRVTYLDDTVDYVYVKEGHKIIKKERIGDRPVTLQDNYNFKEWENASGLICRNDFLGLPIINNQFWVVNSGDIEADYKIILKKDSEIQSGKYYFELCDSMLNGSLRTKEFNIDQKVEYIEIDTKLKLLKGLDSNFKLTGEIFNKYISEGDFFKIEQMDPYKDVKIIELKKSRGFTFHSIEHKHYYYI